MEPISKQDLDSDVMRAVIEHYRHADSRVRIASLSGALFVLKWQAAEKLSGEALAKIASDSVPWLYEEGVRSSIALQESARPVEVWTLLERLASTAVRPEGLSEEEHRQMLDANIDAANALLAMHRQIR